MVGAMLSERALLNLQFAQLSAVKSTSTGLPAVLASATAADAGNYGFKQWNYRYAEQYGSKDWSVADPQKEGRDEISVKSAKVLADGRTVFLALPGLQPVMQFELKYNVDAADGGRALRGSLWGTISQVNAQR